MKSKSTKSQFYRYTLRSVAVTGQTYCTARVFLYPVPPQDAISIESLFTHFRMQFDSAIPSHLQVVEYVGIANERPLLYTDKPAELKKLDLNQAADVNRRIDLKLDLSDLLTSDHIGFTPQVGADYEVGDQTLIVVKVPDELIETLNVGTIELWKADCLYTTKEIR